MSKYKTLLIDLDDTIWDLCPTWLNFLNNKYNLDIKLEDVNQWDMKVLYPTLTENQIYEPLTFESFWNTVPVKEEAVLAIEELNNFFDIYFITATDYRNVRYKGEMIKKFFPFIPINKLIISHNKSMIQGDIIIDDNINNIQNRKLGILFTAAHNRNIHTPEYKNVCRFSDWKLLKKFLKTLIYC